MITTSQLSPLQRDALREGLRSPTHTFVRTGRMYTALHNRQSTSGIKLRREYTGRLMNMLGRDNLIDFDPPDFPARVILNKHGLALAQQLVVEDSAAKAVAS